jgi:hypothetical protein
MEGDKMNCPLSKEEFCNAINSIKEYWDNINKIEDILEVEFYGDPVTNIMDSYEETLSLVMKDKGFADFNECQPLISYFCWDRDFGRQYEEDNIMINGKEYPFYSAEDLYDVLIDIYFKR